MALTESEVKRLKNNTAVIAASLAALKVVETDLTNVERLVAQLDNNNQVDLQLCPKAGSPPLTVTWPGRGALSLKHKTLADELEPKIRGLIREHAAERVKEWTAKRDNLLCEINGLTVEEEDESDNRKPRKVRPRRSDE